MTHEKGTDPMEPVITGSESKDAVSPSQGSQPQEPDAIEGENPKDEADTGSKAGSEPEQSEGSEDNELGGIRIEDEDTDDSYRDNVAEGKKPVTGPVPEENSPPKSTLKMPPGTSDPHPITRADSNVGSTEDHDDTGRKPQEASDPPKTPLSEVTKQSDAAKRVRFDSFDVKVPPNPFGEKFPDLVENPSESAHKDGDGVRKPPQIPHTVRSRRQVKTTSNGRDPISFTEPPKIQLNSGGGESTPLPPPAIEPTRRLVKSRQKERTCRFCCIM